MDEAQNQSEESTILRENVTTNPGLNEAVVC